MLTNAETAERRLKHYDIGLPFLSYATEVYHFDHDYKNQMQASSIVMRYATAPRLVGSDDYNGTVYLSPAVYDVPPYEPNGRSLLGLLSISAEIPSVDSTVEFWIRLPRTENICIFRLKTDLEEELIFRTAGTDPEYSIAAAGDIPYTLPAVGDIAYSIPAVGDNRLYHNSPKGKESAAITGVTLASNTWVHMAAVTTPQRLSLFINNKEFYFNKHFQENQNAAAIINEDRNEINIDELVIDRVEALRLAAFTENTAKRIPYGALDYNKKWAVLMFDNPNRIVTNLFESEQFKAAVKAAIHSA